MIPTQGLRKSAIIASRDNGSLKEKNKVDMELKKNLYTFLRKKTIWIQYCGANSGKCLILNGLVNLKREILRIGFLSNQEFLGKLYHQSMIVKCKSPKRRISGLHVVPCSGKKTQVRDEISRKKQKDQQKNKIK